MDREKEIQFGYSRLHTLMHLYCINMYIPYMRCRENVWFSKRSLTKLVSSLCRSYDIDFCEPLIVLHGFIHVYLHRHNCLKETHVYIYIYRYTET